MTVSPDETVLLPLDWAGAGHAGATYEFIGTSCRRRSTSTSRLHQHSRWKLTTYTAGTSGTQVVTVTPGQIVRLPFGWSDLGQPGALYEYLGAASASLDVNAQNYADTLLWKQTTDTFDLGTEDYTDAARWHKLVGGADDLENLYPGIGNFTNSTRARSGS